MIVERKYKGKKINEKISDYVVVDIETTGLSPTFNKIIEIAAIKVSNGKIVDKFQKLVNPDEKINYYITNLTGITNDMVKNKDKINVVINEFKDFLGNSTIVGHNVNFDINFLYDNLYNTNKEYLTNNYVDTMYVSKKVIPGLTSYKLESITSYLNVDYTGAHRALNDCMFTYKCYEKMKEMF